MRSQASLRLRRSQRIRKQHDFSIHWERGSKLHSRSYVWSQVENGQHCARLGVIVTKKTGNAVVRNRWKRVLRDIFRTQPQNFPKGQDHLLIVKRTVKGPPTPERIGELGKLLAKRSGGH